MEHDSDDPAADDRHETVNQSRFRTLLPQALREFAKRGCTSEADLQEWLLRLEAALEHELPPDKQPRKELDAALESIFERDVDRSGAQQRVPGVEFAARYTISRDLEPALRAELDRLRLLHPPAGTKAAAIQQALQCFAGWVRSGSSKTSLRAVSKEIRELVAQVKYESSCAAIDEAQKLSAAAAHVVAEGHGAIGAIWHSRGEYDKSYDARPEHLARAGKIFLVRDSWAMQEGLVKKAGHQYTDEIEQVAFLPMCSCWYEYVVSPRALPDDVLTAKGREWLERGNSVAPPPETDPPGTRRSQTRKVPRSVPRPSKASRSRHSGLNAQS